MLNGPETYMARLAADREKSLALRERELQRRIDEALGHARLVILSLQEPSDSGLRHLQSAPFVQQ